MPWTSRLLRFPDAALVNRAPVAVAIGTEGQGRFWLRWIRAQIDQLLSPSLGIVASLAANYRDAVDRLVPPRRRAACFLAPLLLGPVADHVRGRDLCIRTPGARSFGCRGRRAGHVWLVGARAGA